MAWFTRLSRFTILATILVVVLTLGIAITIPASVQAQLRPDSLSGKLPDQWESFGGTTSTRGGSSPPPLVEGTPVSTLPGGTRFRPPRPPGEPTPEGTQAGGTRGESMPVPGEGAPVNTQTGGTRGPCIEPKSLVALVPASLIGETVAEYPSVFWSMPQIAPEGVPAPAVEFVLKDASDREVYSAKYPLAKSAQGVVGAPGIMSLTVASLYPLKIGQEYRWQLTLMCNSKDSDQSQAITVDGGIKRVALDPSLARRLEQATPQERVAIYGEARLWYETLSTLVELGRDRPKDTNLAAAWDKLLSSVGL